MQEIWLGALPVPPSHPQAAGRASPAGSGACPAGKGAHRWRRSWHWPPPRLWSLYPPWPLTPAISSPFKMSLLGPRHSCLSGLAVSNRSELGAQGLLGSVVFPSSEPAKTRLRRVAPRQTWSWFPKSKEQASAVLGMCAGACASVRIGLSLRTRNLYKRRPDPGSDRQGLQAEWG